MIRLAVRAAAERRSLTAANQGLRLIAASLAVSTVGTGMWTSARVMYLARTGLSAAEIGTGLLIAGLVGAAATVPCGRLVDRYALSHSRRDATIILLAIEGVLAALFAVVHGFAAFLLVASLASAAERACAAAAATLIGEMFGGAKVDCRAAMQAAMNVGLCLGGLLAAAALATGSLAALRAIAIANGLSYLIACTLTRRLAPADPTPPGAESADRSPAGGGTSVPNRYRAFSCTNAVLTVHAALLSVALPLWVTQTHLVPAWTVGGAMFLNSAAVGLWQLPVTRRVQEQTAAHRAALHSGILLALACALIAALGPVPAPARLAVLALAIAIYTLAELAHAASAVYLSYVLAEGHPLSSCQSYFASTVGVSKAIGPLAATAAVATGPPGLLILGCGLLLAGAGVAGARGSAPRPTSTSPGAGAPTSRSSRRQPQAAAS